MSTIGLIPAFDEEANIYDAVTSLFTVGCDRVVVLDGAYRYANGRSFMGGGCSSSDETQAEAESAGAIVVTPKRLPRFGEKRDMLLRLADADEGDHVLFLDADERAVGRIPAGVDGHACVLLRNLKPNDLPGLRSEWPRGDAGPVVPLLRFLRWSPTLRFLGPGRFAEEGELVRPYLVQAFGLVADATDDPVVRRAYLAVRELEGALPADLACVLPLLDGLEIHHLKEHSAERVEAKREVYV